MRILILGGTAFLGRHLATAAIRRGHEVVCVARGLSGPTPSGARLIPLDRTTPFALDALGTDTWDAVIELSWQPGLVGAALEVLSPHAHHWTYVSSVSVYAAHDTPGADEGAAVLGATSMAHVGREDYGEAKVACELASQRAFAGPLLIARAGLIGGPGDASDRSGYWVARSARSPHEPMLVPHAPEAATQVIDARDLSSWLIACAEARTAGTFNAVGPSLAFNTWLEHSRTIGRHTGEVVEADATWLERRGVREYAGPVSLPMWVDEAKAQRGWSRRSGAAAVEAGLRTRPTPQMLADVLRWERRQGLDRKRSAGLEPIDERRLIAELRRPQDT